MAFQPFVVGTVIRIWTSPLASRTGRITPGITERMAGLFSSKRSRTSRTPCRMACSTLSFPWTFRSRMEALFEAFAVQEIDAERPVFIAQSHSRPFAVEVPFHSHNLLIAHLQ